MTLGLLPYKSLDDLLAHEPTAEEDPSTAKLIKRLRHVKHDRELPRDEFIDICYWKSARSIRRCERNSAKTVETISRKVFTTRSERTKIELLTSLQGVSVPIASAVLTLTDPRNYGVIDIRVWELLFALKAVTNKPKGQNFNFNDWVNYLDILRHHAHRMNISVRLLEFTLFKFHQAHQLGTLYRRS